MLAFVPSTPVHHQHVLFRTSELDDYDHGYSHLHRVPTSSYAAYDYAHQTALAEHDYLLARARREAFERQQAQAYYRQRQQQQRQEILAVFAADLAEERRRARIRRQQEEAARRQQELLALRQRRQRQHLQQVAWLRQQVLAEVEQRRRQEELARLEQARRRQQQAELSKLLETFFTPSEQGSESEQEKQPASAPRATPAAQVPSTTVDVKGKGKAKEEPMPACSSDSAPQVTVEHLLRQRAQVENDQEVQGTLTSLLQSFFNGSAQAQAPKERKNVRFNVNEQAGPSNSSAEPATLHQGEPATAALDPSPSAPGAPSLERKPALAGASAEQVRAHRHQRTSSLDEIANIRASFDSLSSDFHLPEHLDFNPSPTPSRSPSPVLDHSAESENEETLAYTANNRPLHQYTHALGLLLVRLDAVESDGDDAVRKARKDAVVVVERELERVEREVEKQRPGSPVPKEDADAKADEPAPAEEATVDGQAAPSTDEHVTVADPETREQAVAEASPDQSASENVHEAASEDVPAMEVHGAPVDVHESAPFDALSSSTPIPDSVQDTAGTSALANTVPPDAPKLSPIEDVSEELPSLESPEESPAPSEASTSTRPQPESITSQGSPPDEVAAVSPENSSEPIHSHKDSAADSQMPASNSNSSSTAELQPLVDSVPASEAQASLPASPLPVTSTPDATAAGDGDVLFSSPINSDVSVPSSSSSEADGDDSAVVIEHVEVPPAGDVNDHPSDESDGWSDVEDHL
ncbi:hypothetical protein PUNSTDRAFT_55133 [Punctularia strigosozonata HHB-11173 SS5]|uniref:BAG domain-containing protein n=1 Tax=Punctularia strigosozonata (strain HHB-11173) TaxID=741275 RepID=R7S5K5_PUNST|nr:uncharacterized protein PUNSTDRAFT_55133 [Punctularia strigosozonata HHB-11173 SS5]EIN05237.1 hypothetical protein PUNSTDRAFT_55133 [Punctularia strigosozonata HHB-11173 SS5]